METDRAHAGLGDEVGNAVADADVALLFELVLRLGEDVFRPAYLNSNAPFGASSIRQQRLIFVVEQFYVRFLTVPANTKAPSGRRISGRSKRNELFARKSSSAAVLARCRILLRWGNRPKRLITATCRWKIS